MKKDYRQELELAARQMIRIHKVETVIRLTLRTIIKNLGVNHAGVLLFDKDRQEYVLRVSRGKTGMRIPAGFAKIRMDNPIIRYFTESEFAFLKQDFLLYPRVRSALNNKSLMFRGVLKKFLFSLADEMELYQVQACIPGFFRHDLIGVLFLGQKKNKRNFNVNELSFLSILASDVVMAIKNATLIEDLNRQLDVNKRLFLSTITALSTVIEAKDKYTRGHTQRVVDYALRIADKLCLDTVEDCQKFKENLSVSALLHDIGKISVPEHILNKKGVLNAKERECVVKHPLTGEEILTPIKEFQDIIVGVKYHHERHDGKGYPSQLKGKDIPLIASIIAVADSYDAMTTDRPYRKALTMEEAIEEIKRNRGTQFSPKIVDAFVKALRESLSKSS